MGVGNDLLILLLFILGIVFLVFVLILVPFFLCIFLLLLFLLFFKLLLNFFDLGVHFLFLLRGNGSFINYRSTESSVFEMARANIEEVLSDFQ